ncbi:MAG: YIP1 family protein [Patescibacteria group bacterium]
MLDQLIMSGIAFGRTTIGLVVRPYETYRKVVGKGGAWELVYVAALAIVYFSLASLVKVAAFRPFLLSKHAVVLAVAALVTYMLVVCVVWLVGKQFGGKGTMKGIAVGWGYTMLPTVCWFFMTSLLYILLPPPRTASIAGTGFSVLFLVVSTTLFFWKLTLGYLTLRFGLKLDLWRILAVVGVVGPVMGVWSWGMYRLGIFRVPFL